MICAGGLPPECIKSYGQINRTPNPLVLVKKIKYETIITSEDGTGVRIKIAQVGIQIRFHKNMFFESENLLKLETGPGEMNSSALSTIK